MATAKHPIDKVTFDKATEQGQRLLSRGPLATAARYEAGRIHVELDNGCAFEFPTSHTQGLSGASAADLRHIEISGAGLALYWPKLDADLYVHSLVKGVLGTKQWMAQIGAAGGKASSKAKSEASRANGRLGGRPRISQVTSG
jgi:hypothetical protein